MKVQDFLLTNIWKGWIPVPSLSNFDVMIVGTAFFESMARFLIAVAGEGPVQEYVA